MNVHFLFLFIFVVFVLPGQGQDKNLSNPTNRHKCKRGQRLRDCLKKIKELKKTFGVRGILPIITNVTIEERNENDVENDTGIIGQLSGDERICTRVQRKDLKKCWKKVKKLKNLLEKEKECRRRGGDCMVKKKNCNGWFLNPEVCPTPSKCCFTRAFQEKECEQKGGICKIVKDGCKGKWIGWGNKICPIQKGFVKCCVPITRQATSTTPSTVPDPVTTTEVCDDCKYIEEKLDRNNNLQQPRKLGILSCLPNCAAIEMLIQYLKMKKANCIGCDKYFHCKANYNAVSNCWPKWYAKAKSWVISECRELAQGYNTQDAIEDRAANDLGRSEGDCEATYLCKPPENCAWDPKAETCNAGNCPSDSVGVLGIF